MHEYSIVEELVEKLCRQLKEQGIKRVEEIRLRRSTAFSGEALQQAYEMLVPDTPLENARLVIEEIIAEHTCPQCGLQETVTEEKLVGHMYICPQCGTPEPIDEAHGLELIEVTT